jgi:hypothetical protein
MKVSHSTLHLPYEEDLGYWLLVADDENLFTNIVKPMTNVKE